MEEHLAKELARSRIHDERIQREKDRVHMASDEIKELQAKISAAIVNKERSAQIAEAQYRRQLELESNTQIDKTMLQVKEAQDAIQREASQKRLDDMLQNKYAIQR